jgi:hypothetical protein
VYKVPEGNEPFFFTKYFNAWDPVKAAVSTIPVNYPYRNGIQLKSLKFFTGT